MSMPKSDLFLVGPVVFSYADSLYTPRSVNNGPAKYSCNILFDDNVRQQIEAYVEPLGLQAFPDEWNTPNRCHRPIRPLNERPQYQEQLGILPQGIAYFASCGSGLYPPKVVGKDQQAIPDIIDPMTGRKPMYGGCVGYIQINAFSYRHPQGGPGVSLGVSTVIKLADGNPLVEGGGVNIGKLFESIPTAMPAGFGLPAGQAAPQGQAQPQAQQQQQFQPTPQAQVQPQQAGMFDQYGNPIQPQPQQQVQQVQQAAPLQQGQQFQQAQTPPAGQQQQAPAVHPTTGAPIPGIHTGQ